MTRVIGIDPGTSGALALVGSSSNDAPCVWDIPLREIPRQGKTRSGKPKSPLKVIDEIALSNLLRELEPDEVFVEDVHAMPGWGVTGAWSFAKALGTIIGCVGGVRGLRPKFVTPRAWQKHHGIAKAEGNLSRELAIKLVPSLANQLNRIKHHNRAEALLIALYGLIKSLPRSNGNGFPLGSSLA